MNKERMKIARNIYIKLRSLSCEELQELNSLINKKVIYRSHSASFDVSDEVNRYIR